MTIRPPARPAEPVHPILRWGGRASKTILWLAAVGAAIATIVGWSQLAIAAANPHAAAYASLHRLGVAVTVDHFVAVLGEPAAVTHIDEIASDAEGVAYSNLDRQVFLQEDFIVSILSDDRGEVQQYTVLSCDPSFQPSFRTPLGSTVKLNSQALSNADTADIPPERIIVATGGTASTPVQLLDVMRAEGDGHSRYRGYGLGISELCVDFSTPDGTAIPEYDGSLDGLNESAALLRGAAPANYYVEFGMSFSLLSDGVRYVVPPQESIPTGYLVETFGP